MLDYSVAQKKHHCCSHSQAIEGNYIHNIKQGCINSVNLMVQQYKAGRKRTNAVPLQLTIALCWVCQAPASRQTKYRAGDLLVFLVLH